MFSNVVLTSPRLFEWLSTAKPVRHLIRPVIETTCGFLTPIKLLFRPHRLPAPHVGYERWCSRPCCPGSDRNLAEVNFTDARKRKLLTRSGVHNVRAVPPCKRARIFIGQSAQRTFRSLIKAPREKRATTSLRARFRVWVEQTQGFSCMQASCVSCSRWGRPRRVRK